MSDLSTFHLQSMERISSSFFERGDGVAAAQARSETVDEVVAGLFAKFFPERECEDSTVLAVGGYGRAQLFPHSDVDLLFLFRRESDSKKNAARLSALLTALWDAQLRVSQSVRTPAECSRLAPDNAELHISLLDARYLAGDRSFHDEFAGGVLPKFFLRERQALLKSLVAMWRNRRGKFGGTIYHLEPDIKEGPGGLRDFQTACWTSQLAHIGEERLPSSEETLPADSAEAVADAKRFLFAVRFYLHYFNGRDNNRLLFDLQDKIAHDGSGKAFPEAATPAEWMCELYRRLRAVSRLSSRMIEEYATPKHSLFTLFRDRKSRLSNADFSVAGGRVYFRYSRALQAAPELGLKLFAFVARHGVPPAAKTERIVASEIERIKGYASSGAKLWPVVAEILRQRHAYLALTAMRETGALFAVFPEFEAIDCLVVRDFFHRYTVDEHTFVTIDVLKSLDPEAGDRLAARFARLVPETERPELLYLALLFHDTGKGVDGPDHIRVGVRLAEKAMERIGVAERDREEVGFLIRRHLEMSGFITKRDVSDPKTVQEFAEIVGTIERLKLLTLMTYADTSAVNPKAMTPWRKELLWQLYLSTYNRLTAEAEDRRIHVDPGAQALDQASDAAEREALREFLEGFPERYLRTHAPEQIRAHMEMSKEAKRKGSAVSVEKRHALYDLVVMAEDRPFLFASLCAVMAAYGLNIERAEAFANENGLVLDSFTLSISEGRGGTDLDPNEIRQFSRTLRRVIKRKEDIEQLLSRRRRFGAPRGRIPIEPSVSCDNEGSSRATIFHVTAEDRTGLLFDLAGAFSRHGFDIEVVLIETQGRRAMDVFFVVGPKGKLSAEECETLARELRGACGRKAA